MYKMFLNMAVVLQIILSLVTHFKLMSDNVMAASDLCDAEELPVLPASPSVGGAGSKSRKKSLSWQQQATASSGKEQHHNLRQQAVTCSEQSEDEVTAETSLLPHQEEQPAEEKVNIFGNPPEITGIQNKPSDFQDSEISESGLVL